MHSILSLPNCNMSFLIIIDDAPIFVELGFFTQCGGVFHVKIDGVPYAMSYICSYMWC